jgi:hypothetical protein
MSTYLIVEAVRKRGRGAIYAVLATTAIVALLPAAAAASTTHTGTRMSLSQAPAGLRAAVEKSLGGPASPGAFQQSKLTASDGATGDYAGTSVMVTGSYAIVGAPDHNSDTGAAYIFFQSGGVWTQQAEFNGGAAGDLYGDAVGIANTIAVVGSPDQSSSTGAAYIFTRSGTTWTQRAELTASDGDSVAQDGGKTVVGADGKNSSTGAAYVFEQTGSTWIQYAKLTASDGVAGDDFGYAVAIHGPTGPNTTGYVVVGAPDKNSDAGAAYVYVLNTNGTYSQQQELTASDEAAGDAFGSSAGTYGALLAVGAPHHNSSAGAAYVFARSGTVWSQQAELTASDAATGDEFGYSVALSKTVVAVGAPDKNSGTGAAYVFTQSGTAWPQETELTASDGAPGDHFGDSVGASAGNAAVVVGAPENNSDTGAGYAFAVPTQQAEPTASDGAAGDDLGTSVGFFGTTAVVGAPGHNSGTGAVYVFIRSGDTWTQKAELTASDGGAGDRFGTSLAIYGANVVIGAPDKNSDTGAVYVFNGSGSTWTQKAELTSSDAAAGDYFGWAVGIHGSTVVVGAPDKNSNTGAAYVFVLTGGIWSQQAKLTASDGAANNYFGESVATSGTITAVGAPSRNSSTGATYVFVQSGTTWPQTKELTASDGVAGDSFGWAVAIWGSNILVGAPNHNSDTGAGYVFAGSGSTWGQKAELSGGGSSVAFYSRTIILGQASGNAAYVFTGSLTNWTRQAMLTGSDTASGDGFGDSVALYGNTAVIGAPEHNSATGAAYAYMDV